MQCSLKLKSAIRKNTYDLDNLQQYGRRENLRINGMPEKEGENLRDKIIELGQVTGVDIRQGDIDVVHRSGPKGGRPHQVICRFISRDTKSDLLKNKKKFKDSDYYKKAFIHEDSTPLRARLFKIVKELPNVKSAFTREGIFHCSLHDGSHCSVESPDDLFRLGHDDVDFNALGLQFVDCLFQLSS